MGMKTRPVSLTRLDNSKSERESLNYGSDEMASSLVSRAGEVRGRTTPLVTRQVLVLRITNRS